LRLKKAPVNNEYMGLKETAQVIWALSRMKFIKNKYITFYNNEERNNWENIGLMMLIRDVLVYSCTASWNAICTVM